MQRGERVEAKLRPGLGNWVAARFIEQRRDTVVVEAGGVRYELAPSKVRTPKVAKPKPKERRCSYCKDVGHDIRDCEKLRGMAASVQERGVKTVTRPFTRTITGGSPDPKPPPPVRSERYLQYVRTKPCMWCGAPPPSDPDHVGPHGLAQKTDDLRTVPACRTCHDERHTRGRVKPHSKEETHARVLARQVDLLVGFFREAGHA